MTKILNAFVYVVINCLFYIWLIPNVTIAQTLQNHEKSIFLSDWQPMPTRHGDFKFSLSRQYMAIPRANLFDYYTSKNTFGKYFAGSLNNVHAYWIGRSINNKSNYRWIFGAGLQLFGISYREPNRYNYYNHSFSAYYNMNRNEDHNVITYRTAGYQMQIIYLGAGISIEQKLFNRWFAHITAMPNIGLMFASRYLRADTVNKENQINKLESVSRGVVDTLADDFLDSKLVTSKFVNRFAVKLKVNAGINYYITKRLAASVDFGFNYGIPHKAYVMDIEIYYPNQPGRPLFKRDKVYFTQNTVDIELGLKYKF